MSDMTPKPSLSEAEKYRLVQAERVLREAGFVPHSDGTWHSAQGAETVESE